MSVNIGFLQIIVLIHNHNSFKLFDIYNSWLPVSVVGITSSVQGRQSGLDIPTVRVMFCVHWIMTICILLVHYLLSNRLLYVTGSTLPPSVQHDCR
jgi:hypothetical protein